MRFWTALRSNWPIKLGAFLIAVGLWAHVKTDQTYERVIDFPLQVAEQSGRFVVANVIPKSVKVRVTGTGKDLLFRGHRGRVVIRPRVSQREAITVDLTPDNVEGIDENAGYQVVSIDSPQSVLLDFDYFDTREVSVIPRASITLRPGYTIVGNLRTDPQTVRIGGPRRYVRDLDEVDTDSLALTDVANDVEETVPVVLPSGENLKATPSKVKLEADVQVLLERRFSDVPIRLTHVPRGVQAQTIPGSVNVDVIGGDKIVSTAPAKQVVVELDYRQRFEKGLDDLPLTATLPRYVKLVRLNPPTASIVISGSHGRK